MGWRGTVGLRGRREPIHGGLVAACSCALSCAHGKTGVGRPAQPARGMPRAHAAHTPQTHSAPPSTGSRGCWQLLVVGADRWSAHLSDIEILLGSEPVAQQRDPTPRPLVGADRWSTHLSDIDIRSRADQRSAPTNSSGNRHPPKQIAVLTDRGELSKAGWVRLRGCERHGCRDQAPMDGFTASPSTGPTPPSHGMQVFDVDVDVALACSRCRAASPAKRPPFTQEGCRVPDGCRSGSTAECPARPVSAAG